MKKIVSVAVAALLLVALCGLSVAASSKSDPVEVTKAVDGSGNAVTLSYAAPDTSVVIDETTALAAAKEAGELSEVTDATKLVFLQRWDISAATTPVTITFRADGKTASTELLVFHHNGTKWVLEGSGPAPEVTVTFNSLSPVAVFAIDQTTSGTGTGDNSHVFLWGSLMVVAALGAVGLGIFAKRKKQ